MIIFDLDGTLLDTVEDLHISLNYALKAHNLPLKTKQETTAMLGNGIDILVAKAINSDTTTPIFNSVFTTFKEYYSQHLNDNTAPYPQIIELLEHLKQQNIKTGIVSNKFDYGVKELHKKFFTNLIDYAQGIDENIKKKPSPDAIFAIIDKLNAQNEKNIFVGDSEVDIETAQNANIPCISVSWGFKTKEFLIQHNATHIIDTPLELLDIIDKL